jgi:hypothetical protein
MTTAAATSIAGRVTGRPSRWLSGRNPLHTEAAAVLALYGLYEFARGLVVGNAAEAERHARRLAATERSLHLLLEAQLQSAVHVLPGLTSLLAAAYLTLHLTVTAAVLLWLHQRRPAAFPFARVLGALYPPFVLLVIVATGNHFFLDAAAGAITVALAAASARVITRSPGHQRLARLPEQPLPARRPERLAA